MSPDQNHVWQDVSAGLTDIYLLSIRPSFVIFLFSLCSHVFYLACDRGNAGGGSGRGLVGAEFRAPG